MDKGCRYLCFQGELLLLSNNCTEFICKNKGGPCFNEGQIVLIPCIEL